MSPTINSKILRIYKKINSLSVEISKHKKELKKLKKLKK